MIKKHYFFDVRNGADQFVIDCAKYHSETYGRSYDKPIAPVIETTEGYWVPEDKIWTKPIGDQQNLVAIEMTGEVVEPKTFETFEI